MSSQLAKLNEVRVQLHNASMGVTDTQYCLILLHALPPLLRFLLLWYRIVFRDVSFALTCRRLACQWLVVMICTITHS